MSWQPLAPHDRGSTPYPAVPGPSSLTPAPSFRLCFSLLHGWSPQICPSVTTSHIRKPLRTGSLGFSWSTPIHPSMPTTNVTSAVRCMRGWIQPLGYMGLGTQGALSGFSYLICPYLRLSFAKNTEMLILIDGVHSFFKSSQKKIIERKHIIFRKKLPISRYC